MHAPMLIFLALSVLSLGIDLERHGKPKEGTHNFWISLASTLIVFGLMYWGGFFAH